MCIDILSRAEWLRRIDEFFDMYIRSYEVFERYYVPGNSPCSHMRWAANEIRREIALDRQRKPIYIVMNFRDRMKQYSLRHKEFLYAYRISEACVENFT